MTFGGDPTEPDLVPVLSLISYTARSPLTLY